MKVVHNFAQLGFGTGTNELYDRYALVHSDASSRILILGQVPALHIQRKPWLKSEKHRRPTDRSMLLSMLKSMLIDSQHLMSYRIGSGTGIFTRALLEHPDWVDSIAELRAIEPSLGMRETFSKAIQDPRVSVAEGVFEWTEVEAGWADIIIVAQVTTTISHVWTKYLP